MSSYPDAPGHRNIDTSMEAASDLAPKVGPLQRIALGAIRNAGCFGLTSDELMAIMGMERWSVQPRTSELKRKGLIRDSGLRRRNASGKHAIVWVAR